MSSSPPGPALRRRHWLVIVPVGLLAVGVAAYRFWPARGSAADEVTLSSIAAGQSIEARWTIVRVGPMHLGAIPVVLETHEGQRYQVDVLARDPSGPRGVAQTEQLSLFVVNSHTDPNEAGQRPTDEEQGLGALALARALGEGPPPPGLLTMHERQQSHPERSFGVALR